MLEIVLVFHVLVSLPSSILSSFIIFEINTHNVLKKYVFPYITADMT